MAADGTDEVNYGVLPNLINNYSAGNMISIRKTNAIRNEKCIGDFASGLNNKIQELGTEQEVRDFNHCSSHTPNDQDIPLDFSVKRRNSFSGSLTDDSDASSSSSSHMTEYNTMSPPTVSGFVHDNLDNIKIDTPSTDDVDDRSPLDQSDVGVVPVKMSPLINSFTFFPGLSSNLLRKASAINAFSKIAAAVLKDPHHKRSNCSRKAYPKDILQMPLEVYGIPGLAPSTIQQSVELSMLMSMNNETKNHVRDNKLSGHECKISTPSQSLSSYSSKQSYHHLYQQQNQHHNFSLPNTTLSIMFPPLLTTDHLKTTIATCSAYPTSITSGSFNTTLVSSTSSFAFSNSRKRPHTFPEEHKDAAYWERRRKNNDAAKRSRDARRAKEDEIALRTTHLEQENLKLRVELASLKTETERLRCMLYN